MPPKARTSPASAGTNRLPPPAEQPHCAAFLDHLHAVAISFGSCSHASPAGTLRAVVGLQRRMKTRVTLSEPAQRVDEDSKHVHMEDNHSDPEDPVRNYVRADLASKQPEHPDNRPVAIR
jgi:hypothetical protein